MDIYVDEAGILNIANKIMDDNRSMLAQINMLNTIIDDINENWQGADALKYINIMREKYIIVLRDLNDFIDEYSCFLNNIPGAYSTLDEVFESKNIDV